MGRELETTVTFAGVTRKHAKVHLDSKALQVSGRPRIEVAFAEVQRVVVDGERLVLSTARGELSIRAGEDAEAWAQKIRTPPSRAKKLGLRAGQRVALRGLDDAGFSREVESSGAELVPLQAGADVLFLGVAAEAELAQVPALVKGLSSDGALWVVRTKGRSASVSENAVRSAARGAGLVDVKVVAFSETQSADKFVIPVAERAATTSRKAKPKAAGAAARAPRASATRARAPARRARTA